MDESRNASTDTRDARRPASREEGTSRLSAGTGDRVRVTDLRWLLPFVKPHWQVGAVAAVLALFSTVVALALPLTFKALTDAAVSGGDQGHMTRVVWAAVGMLVLIAAADFVKQVCFVRFQQQVILGVQHHLVHRLLRLPKIFFDANRTGYLMSRVVGDVVELQAFFSLNLVNVVTRTLQFVGAFGFLVYLNIRLTALSLIVLPLFIVLTRAFGGRLRHLSRAALEKTALVSQDLEEAISATTLIKAFAAEEREAARVTERLREAFAATFRRAATGAMFGLLSGVLNAVGMGAVLWYGASLVISRQLTIGELLAFSVYLGLLIQPAQFLAGLNVTMQQSFAALERVLELLKLIPEDDDTDTRTPITRLDGRVTFQGVSFAYDARTLALNDVSFTAGPRQVVAIVGRSGAGKSTLVNLIIGLYQCGSGRICFGDVAAEQFNRRSLRERIGFVFQEIFLFDDSIANNIRFGRPDTSDEQVLAASRQAGAHEFVTALPDGYETRVGEGGVKLSVGQKQRIAIARAIVKDPEIVIFDEATSALDAVTERTVRSLMKELGRSKTVFVIAHRLSTVLLSDSILVLDQGRIVQRGTHAELWRADGLYRELCRTDLADPATPDEHGSTLGFDIGAQATGYHGYVSAAMPD